MFPSFSPQIIMVAPFFPPSLSAEEKQNAINIMKRPNVKTTIMWGLKDDWSLSTLEVIEELCRNNCFPEFMGFPKSGHDDCMLNLWDICETGHL